MGYMKGLLRKTARWEITVYFNLSVVIFCISFKIHCDKSTDMDQERYTFILEELARFGFVPYPAVNNDGFVPVTKTSAIKEELFYHKEVSDHLQAIGYWDNFKKAKRTMFIGQNAIRFHLAYETKPAEATSILTATHVLEYKKYTQQGTLYFEKHACYINSAVPNHERYPRCYIYRSDDVPAPSISQAFEMTQMIAIQPHDINYFLAEKLRNRPIPEDNKKPIQKRRKGRGPHP